MKFSAVSSSAWSEAWLMGFGCERRTVNGISFQGGVLSRVHPSSGHAYLAPMALPAFLGQCDTFIILYSELML